MKICHMCKEKKPLFEFNKNKTKKDGYGSECRSCMKILRKNHYDRNKDQIINDIAKRKQKRLIWLKNFKSNLSCEKCGENHIATLDFHHKNPKKKEFQIGYAVRYGYGKEKILNEIKKCNILCSNCHRKLHWKEQMRV